MKYHFFQLLHLADDTDWPTGALSLPTGTEWRDVNGFESKLLSNIGDYVSDLTPTVLTPAQAKSVPIYMQGIQARFAIQNRSNVSCIARAMLVYIPNLNGQTDDAVDFLRPDIHMLGKTGTGNLQFDGWMKKGLNSNATSAAAARRYTILDRKKIYLPPTRSSGQQVPRNIGGTGTPAVTVMADVAAYQTKFFTLSKYFKGHGKKHQIKSSNVTGQALNDGNYYYILWTDHAPGVTYSYVNVTTLKFRVGSSDSQVNP